MLWGHSNYLQDFRKHGIVYRAINNDEAIIGINQIIMLFGYERVFGPEAHLLNDVKAYKDKSPIAKVNTIALRSGYEQQSTFTFGKRHQLPKWITHKK